MSAKGAQSAGNNSEAEREASKVRVLIKFVRLGHLIVSGQRLDVIIGSDL